jgi:hypothetical protein
MYAVANVAHCEGDIQGIQTCGWVRSQVQQQLIADGRALADIQHPKRLQQQTHSSGPLSIGHH